MASQAAPFSLSLSSRILSPKFPLLPSSSRSFSSFPKFLSPKFPSLHCHPKHPQMKSSTGFPRFSVSASAKPISVADPIPDATLSYFDSSSDELKTVTVSELTKGKKTVLFAVPGAFTPTCSQKHVPGFIAKSGELKSKGVDVVACVSVNDAFVMKAWKKDLGVGGDDEVLFLSDGNGEFTRKLGVELDLSDKPVGLGVRSRRYALLAEDGVVKVLNLEEGGTFEVSSAEEMLNAL